jgi:hypothetical protein
MNDQNFSSLFSCPNAVIISSPLLQNVINTIQETAICKLFFMLMKNGTPLVFYLDSIFVNWKQDPLLDSMRI